MFKQGLVELGCAHLKSNFKFRGCWRSLWPQTSHIRSFLFKYHVTLAILCIRLFRGHFATDLILLLKPGYLQFDLNPQNCFEASEILLWAN